MIHRHDTLPSTNDEALRLAKEGAETYTTVVADHQTAGRGRAGHSWEAPAGAALLCSVLLRPRIAVGTLPLCTLAAGLAVCDAIRRTTTLEPALKWTNDVLVRGRKCCGILCESIPETNGSVAVVAGIGINVSTPAEALPPRTIFPATSLAIEGAAIGRDELLAALLPALRERIEALEGPDGAARTIAAFNGLDALRGLDLLVDGAPGGIDRGLDDEGHLLLEQRDGTLRTIVAGSISIA